MTDDVHDADDGAGSGASRVTEDPHRKIPEAEDFPASGPNALAAPGPRYGARGLDLALVAVPAAVVAAFSVSVIDGQAQVDLPSWLPWLLLGVGLVYEVVTVALWGRTVGKWLFGLRVARYTDGQRPKPDQALLRALLPWAVFSIPVSFSGALMLGVWLTGIGGGALHRGLPDKAGGTIVVTTR